MKKVAILAVLAMTAPLFAANAITVSGADAGGGVLRLTFSGSAPLGLAVIVDPDASGQVASYVAGSADSFFDVFMDYASTQVPTPGYTLGTGHPLAKTGAAGVPTLPADAVSVCVGHLAAANGGTGKIADIQLAAVGGATSTVVTLTADTFRGSAADAAGAMTLTVTSPVTVAFGPPACNDGFCVGQVFSYTGAGPAITMTVQQTQRDVWVALGKPACWTCLAQKAGNAVTTSGNATVNLADLAALRSAWNKTYTTVGYNACADFNCQGTVNLADLAILRGHWNMTVGTCP